jgi:hypothetical protein
VPKTSDLASILSQKPIVLIVEDRITKEYLYTVWGADQQYFNILTSGGHEVVKGVVTDFRKHGHDTVFGLVDRDFGTDNVARWSATDSPPDVFQPRFHELENILLDWDALAGCGLNLRRKNPSSAVDIGGWARAEATKQTWWLACRKCLSELQQSHSEDFPSVPSMGALIDFQSARTCITGSIWFNDLHARTGRILNTTELDRMLMEAHREYLNDLNTGGWTLTFSGKEIYKYILSRINGVPRTPTAEPDVDLAKSVGEWQLANSAVPKEIDDLKSVLKSRVGLII